MICIYTLQFSNEQRTYIPLTGTLLEIKGDDFIVDFSDNLKKINQLNSYNIGVRQLNGNECLIKQ